ncbi:MAG: Uncharacterized MFS-type transporter, partial [uncultured Chloroflexia bacterium]
GNHDLSHRRAGRAHRAHRLRRYPAGPDQSVHSGGRAARPLPGRARPDDRRHRAAGYHRRSERSQPAGVGLDRLPAREHGDGADLRQAVRPIRAAHHPALGHSGLPGRLR